MRQSSARNAFCLVVVTCFLLSTLLIISDSSLHTQRLFGGFANSSTRLKPTWLDSPCSTGEIKPFTSVNVEPFTDMNNTFNESNIETLSYSTPPPLSFKGDTCLTKGTLSECWLEECQHHLCTPHHRPAEFYMCNPGNREWKITFLNNHFPAPAGDTSRPEVESSNTDGSGHVGWASSIIRGFRSLNLKPGSWNVNPSHMNMLGDVIWTQGCTGSREALNRLGWFQAHRGFIICGAVDVTFENRDDLADPQVGFFIAPSTWVADALRGEKTFNYVEEARIRVLVSGVDVHFFKPSHEDYEKRRLGRPMAVVYVKNFAKPDLVSQVKNSLSARDWDVQQINYGSYNLAQFRDTLRLASAAVFLTATESQSIALAEAWSMDVPTFVYEANPAHPFRFYNRIWLQANEAPYLNNLCGFRWNDIQHMVDTITAERNSWPFRPRYYVLNTMTDAISVWNVLRAAECEWQRRYGK